MQAAPIEPIPSTPPAKALRVTLVNDYEIIVQGLQRMLEPFADRIHVVETEAGGLPTLPTDIALFDTFGGRRNSLARVRAMARDLEIGKVVLYTWDAPPAFRDDVAQQAVDAVILKSETGEALVAALERVHAGDISGFDDLEDLAALDVTDPAGAGGAGADGARFVESGDRPRALLVGRHRQDARSDVVPEAGRLEPHAGGADGCQLRRRPAAQRAAS